MRILSFFHASILTILLGCSHRTEESINSKQSDILVSEDTVKQSSSPALADAVKKKIALRQTRQDSIVLINLSKKMSINWNDNSDYIVRDKLFFNAKKAFMKRPELFVEMILDTTDTGVTACSYEKDLLIGDFAFLLIGQINSMPYYTVFKQQWDSFDYNCGYPNNMFDYIHKNRVQVKKELGAYLIPKAK